MVNVHPCFAIIQASHTFLSLLYFVFYIISIILSWAILSYLLLSSLVWSTVHTLAYLTHSEDETTDKARDVFFRWMHAGVFAVFCSHRYIWALVPQVCTSMKNLLVGRRWFCLWFLVTEHGHLAKELFLNNLNCDVARSKLHHTVLQLAAHVYGREWSRSSSQLSGWKPHQALKFTHLHHEVGTQEAPWRTASPVSAVSWQLAYPAKVFSRAL